MTIFTRDAVSEALHKAVETKGADYVYPDWNFGCHYADAEAEYQAPSCIVGHVVAALDPELFQNWAEYERQAQGDSFSVRDAMYGDEYDYAEVLDEDGLWVGVGEAQKFRKALSADDRTRDALLAAQRVQDLGQPWGDAQEAFDRVMAGEGEGAVVEEIIDRG